MIWDLKKFGENTALIDGEEKISYKGLSEICDDIAGNVSTRTLAFIFTENCVAAIAAYVAFLEKGIVPLMLDSGIDRELSARMRQTYQPDHIWQPEDLNEGYEGYKAVYSFGGYTLYRKEEPSGCTLNDELALLISTSGSTGSPKLVRLSYANILSNTKSIIEYLNIGASERAITSLPLNYVYGLSVLNTHLYAGACLVLTRDNCYSKAFWDCFEKNGATSFAGIPFMYEMMDKLKFTRKKIASLKTMTQAGGKLPPYLHERFADYARENGISFVVMYGASEATARMGYLPAGRSVEKKGSMGIAIPGGRFEIIDDEGRVIDGAGENGELIYYGDNVSLGYAENREDLTRGDDNKGRLSTGDIAYRDAEGYYYIVGRKKRFIKITGKRTNLSEVEMLIKEHFDTVDVACAGADDSLDIYITDEALAESISQYVFESIKITRHLFHIHVIAEIPKNAAGKVQYAALLR